jgi:hypothetical protein
MADPNTGCFERFWMAALAVVAVVAIAAGVAIFNTNRVTAQDSTNTDWSQFVDGMIYLVTPVGQVDRYKVLETPHVQDGFLCTVVDQYQKETCFPLTNIAGIMAP